MSVEKISADEAVLQHQMMELFADGAKVLGLPKSVGGIYGVLFSSREPLALDDLVECLEISKGSASQGLKLLRTLGAVSEVENGSKRKAYYEADLELKSLVGGFIKHEIRPHLDSAKSKIKALREEDASDDEFFDTRIKKLENWQKRAGLVLPILQKFLGK